MTEIIRRTKAQEKGTIIFSCAFTDEDGQAVAPNAIAWTLSDKNGNVINSRDAVPVTPPAATVDIVVSGDDLQISEAESHLPEVSRKLLVEADYNSDIGSNLPIKEELTFYVENLSHVT